MTDDQVTKEELALSENRKQRDAAANATDDGMPVAPEREAQDIEVSPDRAPKQWVRHARTWPAAGGVLTQVRHPRTHH
jgi:hypothetical protein